MPKIFFQPLEKRKSTQSFYGNLGLFNSTSIYGISNPYPAINYTSYGYVNPWSTSYLSSWSNPWSSWSTPFSWNLQGQWSNPWSSSLMNSWNPWNSWTNSFYSPWSNFTSPWSSPYNPWYSPLPPSSIWQVPSSYTPTDPGTNWCYAGGNFSSFDYTKFKNIRKNLIAFFQNKGTLSKNQSQKIISSTFVKA